MPIRDLHNRGAIEGSANALLSDASVQNNFQYGKTGENMDIILVDRDYMEAHWKCIAK